ncbi:MAG: glycosyltransferase family 39 protein [Thermoflexales bacterium]|nr:glycosyltransferase family 39 protein [Thermoflexales bacterium]
MERVPVAWIRRPPARKSVHLLIGIFLALGVLFALTIPPFESPDEPFHLNTIRYITVHHALPPRAMPQHRLLTGADVARSLEYAEAKVFYAPPLYYAVGALLTSWTEMRDLPALLVPNPNWVIGWAPTAGPDPWNKNFYVRLVWRPKGDTVPALYLLRMLSLGFGAITIFSTHTLACRLWPNRPWMALGAAAIVALNPQFVALSAGVTNDNLLIALCTLFFAHIPSCIQRGTGRQWAVLGGIAGLALLTKQSGLLLLPIGSLATICQQASWEKRLRDAGLFLVAALAPSLWWYLRGLMLYGDPLGFGPHFAGQIPLAHFGLREAWTVFQTYWAAFGWGLILVDRPVYWGIATLMGLAGIGLLCALRPDGSWGGLPHPTRCALFLFALAFGLNAIALVRWALATGAPYGRLLFPTIAPVAILTAYGLSQYTRWKAPHLVLWAIAGVALAFNAYIPWHYIRPAFTLTRPVQQIPRGVQSVNVNFQNGLQLLGYEIFRGPMKSGHPVTLTLYWYTPISLTERYRIWVQFGPQDPTRYVAGEDTWLGGTLYPSDLWKPGEIVRQTHILSIPDWAPAPGLYWLRIGLTDGQTGRIPLQDQSGDMVALGPWRLLPAHSPPPPSCPTDYRLGDTIRLDGYGLSWEQEGGQEYLTVTLHWRAEEEVREDYTVFVHLLDGEGNLVSQHDGPPRGGDYPTSWWRRGERVLDTHWLPLGKRPEGPLILRVGMYHPETLERIPAYDGTGQRLAEDVVAFPEVQPERRCNSQ